MRVRVIRLSREVSPHYATNSAAECIPHAAIRVPPKLDTGRVGCSCRAGMSDVLHTRTGATGSGSGVDIHVYAHGPTLELRQPEAAVAEDVIHVAALQSPHIFPAATRDSPPLFRLVGPYQFHHLLGSG